MRSLAFNLFFYSYTFYTALRVWLLARRGRQAAMHRVLRLWGETVLRAVDVILDARVEIRGRENIPAEGPVLFVSKHQSEMDVVLLGALMPDTGAVAMAELERYPFFGTILSALDIVMVAVDQGPQNRTEQTIEGTRRTFGQGRPMMIYPEGTLMRLGERERYRRGAAHIYTRLNPTVVPIATSVGTIWPRREWTKHPHGRGALEFLEPIPPGLSFDAFMAEIETRIESETMRLIREHAGGETLAAAEARYAEAEAARAAAPQPAAG
ncbi:MAG: lysophospholipid acyltransferase family protein [Pseudomonadota bacterium]